MQSRCVHDNWQALSHCVKTGIKYIYQHTNEMQENRNKVVFISICFQTDTAKGKSNKNRVFLDI